MTHSDELDLLVIGCGAAGLSTAVAYIDAQLAAGAPVRLRILESAPPDERGGATRWTSSVFRAMPDYRLDPHYRGRMQEVSKGLADPEYARTFEREAQAALRFLERHGVEMIQVQADVAQSMPHKVKPNGGGRAIIDLLAAVVERTPGAAILYRHEAVKLVLDEEGVVCGAAVRVESGKLRTIRAKSVVLACGGFEGNAEVLSRYLGPDACDLKLLAPTLASNKGAALRMAQDIGAGTAGQFDMIHSELVDSRTDLPDAVIYGHPFGILVNAKAHRFYDEGAGTYDETFELAAFEVWRNQGQSAFFIADRTLREHSILSRLYHTDRDPVEADTLEELASQLGLDPDILVATVNEFNAAVPVGRIDPTSRDGRATTNLSPPKSNWAYRIERPPFLAYPLTTAICFTFGGVKSDAAGRVLSESGIAIPGLYAAGECVGVNYHEYLGSTSVFRSIAFGRLIGEAVAATQHPVTA